MKRDDGGAPPTIARALLGWVLPDNGVRESVLGDLQELYLQRLEGGGGRPMRAGLWYWRQALAVVFRYGVARIRFGRASGFDGSAPVRAGGVRLEWSALPRRLGLALRSLRRSPASAAPALVILAVGMTAATVVLTVVDTTVFRPLRLPDAHRLFMVCEDHVRFQGTCIAAPEVVERLREGTTQLGELGFARGWPYTLGDEAG
ncbi:MAG: hypothetical protein OEO23_07045, partial [Gemmatimonadota bacterium]|nr:hypothetical protein [Gemmatimonadota bacterium]